MKVMKTVPYLVLTAYINGLELRPVNLVSG